VQAQASTVSGFMLLCSPFSHGCTPERWVYEGVNEKTRLESSVPDNEQSPWTAKAQTNRR
jgi:hypothetical protein